MINALMLWLTGRLSEEFGLGFHVAGFRAAFFGALVVGVVSLVLTWLAKRKKATRNPKSQ